MEDVAAAKNRKRKQRAILSCNDCRRRKVKCDRELPCNRCINGGIAEKCVYSLEGDGEDSHLYKRARHSSPQVLQPSLHSTEHRSVDTSPNDRVDQLERQLIELQNVVHSLQDKSEEQPLPDSDNVFSDGPSAFSAGLFKGKGMRTFYYGPTSPITVVAHFPDLRPFMKQVFVGSTLQRLREDTKAQEDRARAKQAINRILNVSNLRSLLPDRNTVDKVVKTYFDTFETTYRILHAPTFWTAYSTFWDPPYELNSDMDALVLAILSCTLCTSTHETPKYNNNGSTFRSKAIVWLRACEAWLRRQSNKRRTLASWQVRLLRLLALSTTCLKTKEYYQEVQAHMAFMVSSGMHRDPSILGSRCSVFDAEMRRRLWATAMELETQASIDKGGC
ncbi:hypothetical protein N0V90_001878 [Kalmusia sp. IMI 367209]|nr:hypothetical protein N0V90_001878 [Kalmusia sp. IMI 367209]